LEIGFCLLLGEVQSGEASAEATKQLADQLTSSFRRDAE
jgi:hypothetical protein